MIYNTAYMFYMEDTFPKLPVCYYISIKDVLADILDVCVQMFDAGDVL